MYRMAGIAAWMWAALANGIAVADGVVIELRADVSVSSPLVLVRDIATLRGGSPAERAAIGALDLVLLNAATPETNVSRRLIEVRMLVAGMPLEDAILTGADAVHVVAQNILQASGATEPSADGTDTQTSPASSRITDGMIEQELEAVCSQYLGDEVENIDVHLSHPVAAVTLRGLEEHAIEFQIVPGQNIAPGPNSTMIQFWQDGELVKSATVRFDVVVHRTVLVLNRFVPRGTALTADMFPEQVRPVNETGLLASAQDAVGTEAQRDLPAGTVLKGNLLRRARQAPIPPAVRTRDLVFVTYSKGGLHLSMPDAVAMQEGRIGDQIRVMNPASRNVFTAVVVGPGRVEVQTGP
jgi:flagella basal body P-ring formation protein FlgA